MISVDILMNDTAALEEQQWNADALTRTVEAARVRLWRYAAPAIVLGCSQSRWREEVEARAGGRTPCLAREAGGGAVLTGPWMLSASVALPNDHAWVKASVVDTYAPLAEAHLAALASLGVAAHALRPEQVADAREAKGMGIADWACFGGLSAWEIVNDEGRKLVGLAQRRRRGGVMLVAGTLVAPPDWALLCEAMGHPEHAAILRQCTVSMAEILGRAVSVDDFAFALERELARRL